MFSVCMIPVPGGWTRKLWSVTFGVPQLLDGIEVTTLAVGLFAIGEALFVASRHLHNPEKPIPIKGSLWMTREDWKRSWKPWLRGVGFGFPIGALPAGGAEIPTFLSYATERKAKLASEAPLALR